MDDIDKDWYTYLTEDFKLDRSCYKTSDRVVVDCPKCNHTRVIRINHLKAKIRKLGFFECGPCRKAKSLVKARNSFKEKHGVDNPYQLKTVKEKIKTTLVESYGVDCILKKPEIHKKGIEAAAKKEARQKAKDTMKRNYGVPTNLEREEVFSIIKQNNKNNFGKQFHLQVPKFLQKTINSIKKNRINRINKWKRDGYKYCHSCKRNRKLEDYNRPIEKLYNKFDCEECYKIKAMFWNSIYRFIKGNYEYKHEITFGCSRDEFKAYIEKQFIEGMTWENFGEWHIDHIIPISKFDINNKDHRSQINHYTNLRPLWAKDNQSRGNFLPKVYLLTGCFGAGKSTISNILSSSCDIYDKDKKHNIKDVAISSQPCIYQTSMKVTQDINLFKTFFDVDVIVILEDFETIKSRILNRSGKFNKESIIKRIKRMEFIAKKYGTFSGTADECLDYLKSKLS